MKISTFAIIALLFSTLLLSANNSIDVKITPDCRAYSLFRKYKDYNIEIINRDGKIQTEDISYYLTDGKISILLYSDYNSIPMSRSFDYDTFANRIKEQIKKINHANYNIELHKSDSFAFDKKIVIDIEKNKLNPLLNSKLVSLEIIRHEIYYDPKKPEKEIPTWRLRPTYWPEELSYKYGDYFVQFIPTTVPIRNFQSKFKKAETQCQKDIDDDVQEIWMFGILSVVGTILGLIISYFAIKKLIKFTKQKVQQAKEKIAEMKKEYNQQKIQKIAEEESIRATVKKSIDTAEDDDLDELQELINKAVAKGDSEMAQALLKILKKKKKK